MDGVLEKITLYDILGYLFPGCVLLMMILTAYKDWTLKLVAETGDNTGILYFAFFLVSYLMGMAISEGAARIVSLCGKIAGKCGCGWLQRKNSWEEPMITALKKSGISNDENEIRRNLKNNSGDYMNYMYGIVQSSAEYKRIHNYKSACVMYKNMILALIAGDIMMYWHRAADIRIYVGCIVICVLLVPRYIRFSAKTNEYTVIWFIDKLRNSDS